MQLKSTLVAAAGLLLAAIPSTRAQEDCDTAARWAPFATVNCYYDWYNQNGANFLNYVGKCHIGCQQRASKQIKQRKKTATDKLSFVQQS